MQPAAHSVPPGQDRSHHEGSYNRGYEELCARRVRCDAAERIYREALEAASPLLWTLVLGRLVG
jgi:hypothetical protein